MAASESGPGNLDLLILQALNAGPMHGWGISQLVLQRSAEVLQINQGSLYPALRRLERRGLIRAEWDSSDNNRRARYYRLSADGRRQLAIERTEWKRYVRAVELVLAE